MRSNNNAGVGVWIVRTILILVVFLMSLTALVQAQKCSPDFYDEKVPTEGICGSVCPVEKKCPGEEACTNNTNKASCTVKEEKNICSCTSKGNFEYTKDQSTANVSILSVCNTDGFEQEAVCPMENPCAAGETPIKCQAQYYETNTGDPISGKPAVDYCFCANPVVDFCGDEFLNTQESELKDIGYCPQTCPKEATKPGYKCQVSIIPNTLGAITACPCGAKVGDLQNHTRVVAEPSGFSVIYSEKTYYTVTICDANDDSCQGSCSRIALSPEFSTPYSCSAFRYSTQGRGLLVNQGGFQATFCACGGEPEPVPKERTPSDGASEKEEGYSSLFPPFLQRLLKALKYVQSYLRKNGKI